MTKVGIISYVEMRCSLQWIGPRSALQASPYRPLDGIRNFESCDCLGSMVAAEPLTDPLHHSIVDFGVIPLVVDRNDSLLACVQCLFPVEGIQTVDECLGLSHDVIEEYGRCEEDYVGVFQSILDAEHIVFGSALPRFLACSTRVARSDIQAPEVDALSLGSFSPSSFKDGFDGPSRVSPLPGAHVDP